MFGIGWTEFVVIGFVLLIVVGPKHLPGVLKKTGMIINELKNASRELQQQVTEEVRDIEKEVGPIPSSPKSYLEDLGREFTDEKNSPYAEIIKAEAEMKNEVSNIKENLNFKKAVTNLDKGGSIGPMSDPSKVEHKEDETSAADLKPSKENPEDMA